MRKLVGFGIILLFLMTCQVNNQLNSDKVITEKIESELKAKSPKIDLSELNSFEWDNLLILGPYSVVKHMGDTLHLDLKNIRDNSTKYRESFRLLAFLKNSKSVRISKISRKLGELENLNILVEKSATEFIRTDNGIYKIPDEKNKNQIRRLIGIPNTAFWVGKDETGNWFNVDWMHNHKNNAIISVYDNSGDLLVKSKFMKVCTGEGKLIEDLKLEIDFYDGENIQLNENSCYLMKR